MAWWKVFSQPKLAPVEQWATRNAKKATPDDLIAGAIVASFAKDHKHWQFVGDFHQKHGSSTVKSTSLTREMAGKKNVRIVFLFKRTYTGDVYPVYKYRVIGCEVNGTRMTDAAFTYIYTNWQNVSVAVRAAEEAAAKAKLSMEINEKKWDLAEGLLGMKRNKVGVLMPIKTAEGEAS